MASILSLDGTRQEYNVTLEDVKDALDGGLSIAQHLNNKLGTDTDVEKYGLPFDQLMASDGFFTREDRASGIRPPSMKQVLTGGTDIAMGPLTRPDGSQALTISGRLLFAAALGEMVESTLREDWGSYLSLWNNMIATTQGVNSPRIDWPTIDITGPRASRSMPIAQMAEPANMAKITLSEKSARLPVFSIGLEIAHQALETTTLDMVGIITREQAERERINLVQEAIKKLVIGDVDWGLSALPSELVTAYDSTIASNGVITHRAWVKWLRKEWLTLNIDWVICDLDTFLAIEGRTGRPTTSGDEGQDTRLNSLPVAANPNLPASVNFFIVDTAVIGANTLVGLDSRKAIKKWLYTGASYEAVENYALRRSTAMRWDFSEAYTRIFDSAFKKMTLTTS